MRTIFILLLSVAISSEGRAQIYRWRDVNGVTHFSNTPHENAVIIELKPLSPLQIPRNSQKSHLPIAYQQLRITAPANEANIFNNQGEVHVSVLIQPPLGDNDYLILLLDGKQVAKLKLQQQILLNNIDRGTHQLRVQLVTAQNKVLTESKKIIFHMHRAIVALHGNTQ